MIEQINNFANFNLAAILFAVIGGGVFITVFHYALLPILNIILIKPLVSVVYNATLERDSFDNKLEFTSFSLWIDIKLINLS